MKKITVCVCAYNAEKYLYETLKSLEAQTMDFDYYFIDDCSTDRTGEIFREFSETTKRGSSFHRMDNNQGIAHCRDFALRHIETEWMMFFDSDDLAEKTLVEELNAKSEEDDRLIAVSCYSRYIDAEGKSLQGGQFIGPTSRKEFFEVAEKGKLVFMLPITLLRRRFALQVGGYRLNGFPEDEVRYCDLSEDLDLWSRMSDLYREGYYMITLPKVLYFYRKTKGSLSTGKERQRIMNYKIAYIKTNLKRRRENKEDLTYSEYLSALSRKEKKKIEREFKSAYYFRNAAFAVAERSYFQMTKNLCLAFLSSPKIVFQKMRANSKK